MWKWCSGLLFSALLGLAPATAQEDDPEKRIRIQDPIKNWTARVFEKNDKDEFVLVGELFGEEARPLNEEKSRFLVKKIRAIYHTQPKKPGERSRKVILTAPEAKFDQAARTIHFYKNVEGRSKDGTLLKTKDLRMDLVRQRFSTPETFTFALPGISLRGKGLEADDTLGTFTILEHPEVEATGESSSLLSLREARETRQHLRLTCQGPMTVRRIVDDQDQPVGAWVRATGGTRIQLTSDRHQVEIACDTARILLRKNPGTGEFTLESAELDAVPHLTVRQGENRIEAERGIIEWSTNRSHFTGNVTGSFVPKEGAKPVQFRAQELTDLGTEIHAKGDVELDGLLEDRDEKTIATCDGFRWHKETESGALFGRPWVVVRRGPSTLRAAKILLPNPDSLILQGPKRIRVEAEEDGALQTISLSAVGDISVALRTRMIKMVDRCSVLSRDFRLFARRIDVELPEKGKTDPRIRAEGDVRIRRTADGVALFGDQMESGGKALTVRGWPHATLLQNALQATMAEIRLDPETETVEGFRGKNRIRIRFIEEKTP